MAWVCPHCGRSHPESDEPRLCACGAGPQSLNGVADAAWSDDDAVLPHEGAETPPWAEEAPASERRRGLALFGSEQTRFVLSFVIPGVSVGLAFFACCCCGPFAPIASAIGVTVGCSLYWGCRQATEVGRWIYLAIAVLVWLVAGGVVAAMLLGMAHP